MDDSTALSFSETCTAPVNIAVLKYWGKRNEDLILPLNDSLSATLSQDQLCAKTTVMISRNFTEDKMWLNGVVQSLENPRLKNVISEIKRRASKRKLVNEDGDSDCNDITSWKLHICSKNNFPTAAGLASSAAGYACLVYALSKLYRVEGDISSIARIGSGSACRSCYGGFVSWNMGSADDGSDSVAEQVADELYWPEMRIIILVVSDQQKDVGSTSGMSTSVQTSELLQYRAQSVVPARMAAMKAAVLNKDFNTFAIETMKDSNQLHAVCQDTYPPVFYMNDVSKKIVSLVHKYNEFSKEVKVAYTFDAGPSACLYLLENNVSEVMSIISAYFPSVTDDNGGIFSSSEPYETTEFPEEFGDFYPQLSMPGVIKYIIQTKVGDGPRQLPDKESLLNDEGRPKIPSLMTL